MQEKKYPDFAATPRNPRFAFLLFHPHPDSDAAFFAGLPRAACPGIKPAPSQRLSLSIVTSYPELIPFLTQPCSTVRSRGRRQDWWILEGSVRKGGDLFWELEDSVSGLAQGKKLTLLPFSLAGNPLWDLILNILSDHHQIFEWARSLRADVEKL